MAVWMCVKPSSSTQTRFRSSFLPHAFTNIRLSPFHSTCFALTSCRRYLSVKCSCLSSTARPTMDDRGFHCCIGFGKTPQNLAHAFLCMRSLASRRKSIPQNVDLPPVLPKRKKKPYLKPPRRGSWLRERRVQQPRLLPAPANGLLVPELIPVAKKVLEARATLINGVTQLLTVVPVKACRVCPEIHIGSVGHDIASCRGSQSGSRRGRHDWITGNIDDVVEPVDVYHLTDRVEQRIRHEERFDIDRIPALIELCIQAGIDIPEYPTRRRTKPIYYIGRNVVEVENVELEDLYHNQNVDERFEGFHLENDENIVDKVESLPPQSRVEETIGDARSDQFSSVSRSVCHVKSEETDITSRDTPFIANRTLEAWDAMRSGAKKLMLKYPVKVCGYCPEVHVGPRGHAVKLCGAFKHQWRAGQHGWQEASMDDLIPPKYVWHVNDPDGPPLSNELKTYYGQTPAVVELCLQGGASLPERYRPMLRLDIVIPDTNEVKIAA